MKVNFLVEQINEKGAKRLLFMKSEQITELKVGDEFQFGGFWMKVMRIEFSIHPDRPLCWEAICHEVTNHGTNET